MAVVPGDLDVARALPARRRRARADRARRRVDARHRPDLRRVGRRARSAPSTGSSTAGAPSPGPRWEHDAQVGAFVAGLAGAEVIDSPLVNEGGGIHVDGLGTVLLTETVQLDPGRNPGLTRADVEAELARTIGATAYVWLPRGLTRDYDEFGTRGHVDIVATIPSPGVVLLHEQRDPVAPRPRRLAGAARAARGRPRRAGRALRGHRRAGPADPGRRRGPGRLVLHQPPRRQRRRHRLHLRRRAGRRVPGSSPRPTRAAASSGSMPGRSSTAAEASTASPSSSPPSDAGRRSRGQSRPGGGRQRRCGRTAPSIRVRPGGAACGRPRSCARPRGRTRGRCG